jgi:hypothetical protein
MLQERDIKKADLKLHLISTFTHFCLQYPTHFILEKKQDLVTGISGIYTWID